MTVEQPEQPKDAGGTLVTAKQPKVVGGDDVKTRYGYRLAMAGVGASLVTLLIAVLAFDSAADVAQAIGPVTTLIGTIVGAFFGIAVGASGRDQATDAAIKASAAGAPDDVRSALGILPSGDEQGQSKLP